VTLAALIGIGLTLLYAATAPAIGRRLPPATATRLLVPASLTVAASGLFILAVLAFTWIGQFPEIAEYGTWSPGELRTDSPVPAEPAAVSGVLVVLAAASVVLVGFRRARALVRVHRVCRNLTGAGGLVVVDDERPEAFSTPQPAGRIIVTSGLLRILTPDERRVLLAHEASHLAHRHAWWNLAADLAAAVNPLLRPTARSVANAVERWADEDAALQVGDRRLVARTLARIALLQTRPATPAPISGPAATGGDVLGRVHALLAPAPSNRPLTLVALLALLVATTVPAAAVQHTGETLFERAAGHPATHSA
jgi:Zn-dependent protease with chaperone function